MKKHLKFAAAVIFLSAISVAAVAEPPCGYPWWPGWDEFCN